MFAIFVFGCGVLFYMIGVHIYDSDETKANFERMNHLLSNQKRRLKKKKPKFKEDENFFKEILDHIQGAKDLLKSIKFTDPFARDFEASKMISDAKKNHLTPLERKKVIFPF